MSRILKFLKSLIPIKKQPEVVPVKKELDYQLLLDTPTEHVVVVVPAKTTKKRKPSSKKKKKS